MLSYLKTVGHKYGMPDEGQWSRRSDGAYIRPCGYAEQRFYWDSVNNGTADALENIVVDIRPSVRVETIFNPQNVTRAWIHVKQKYPLLGARIEEQDGRVRFVVLEKNLRTIRPDELVFAQVSSDKQAADILSNIVNSKRTLSPSHPIRLYILTRSDMPQRAHVIYQVCHMVSDGIAQATLKATFLDSLVRGVLHSEHLEDRLALSLASDTLWPKHPRNSPRQRWRLAIAAVMNQLRPLHGGHTLPQKVTTATPYSTVISARVTRELPHDLSARIIAGCKKIGITFGCILPVIGQIAATRLLFQQHMQGKIPEEEWEFRKREPMLTSGPINTRSMMDKDWYENGGKNHVCCVSLVTFTLVLPFMPLGEMVNAKPGELKEIPSFSSFLSLERFHLRAQMIRDQFQRLIKHPLFFERRHVAFPAKIRSIRQSMGRWREELEKPEESRVKGVEISPMEQSRAGPVWTHSGSSIGVTDDIYPRSFPLDLKQGEEPILQLQQRNEIQLHCRPAELYLGSTFERGKMYMFIHWDANVYAEDIVNNFLEEVCRAAEWYLGNGAETLNALNGINRVKL